VPAPSKVIAMSEDQAGSDGTPPARDLSFQFEPRPRSIASSACSERAADATGRILIRGASLIRMDGQSLDPSPCDVLIRGDIIAEVGSDLSALMDSSVEVIDGRGHLVMPGLINGHFHSPANFSKGLLDGLPLELFMLYEVPVLEAPVSARAAYVRTMLGAVEMLKLGVTAVQDDAFFLPVPSVEEIDAVMGAYRDSGMRATVALDQPNVPEAEKLPFLLDIVPAGLKARLLAPPRMGAEALLDHYDHLIGTWHGQDGGRLRAAVSCSAPQRVTEGYLRSLDALSRAHGLPFYIHMLETRLQRVFGQTRYAGRSLIRYVHDLGLLSERMNVIHAVWIDDQDIGLLAASGATVAHNPISNLRLGSGVMPFRRLRDAGVPLCLGSDEIIADDGVNMWAVAKQAGLIHTIGDPDYERWPRAPEILDCLIGGGAAAMRQSSSVGRIAPGYQADLIMIDLDALPFTPLNDMLRQLVYCDVGGAVRLTMVAGRILVREGRVLSVDEAALRAEARAIVAQDAPQRQSVAASAAEWLPHYRAMYRAMLTHDVGMNRWLGDAVPHPAERDAR
jgi:cytosine/adenosine deaminase-related metal-dependent hydrolase